MIIAPFIANAPAGLFDYIQRALGSLSVPIFAVVVIGILTKKVPALGAKIVLIGGVIMYLSSLLFLEPYFRGSALETAQANGITDAAALKVAEATSYPHFLHIMGILFVVNVLIMLIVGKLKPKTTPYEPKLTDEINIEPWKYTILTGIIITLLVLSTYLIF
jgi:SSS family solute:Na+ symporter